MYACIRYLDFIISNNILLFWNEYLLFNSSR